MPMAVSSQMHPVQMKSGKTDAIPAASDAEIAADPAPDFSKSLLAALQPGVDQVAAALTARAKLPAGQDASAAGPKSPLVQKDAATIVPATLLQPGIALQIVPLHSATGAVRSGAATETFHARKTTDNPQPGPSPVVAEVELPAAVPAGLAVATSPAPSVIAAAPAPTPAPAPAPAPPAALPVDLAATPAQPVSAQPTAVQPPTGQTAAAVVVAAQVLPDPAISTATASAAAAVNPAVLATHLQTPAKTVKQIASASIPAGRGGATPILSGMKPAATMQARVMTAPAVQVSADPAPADDPAAAPVAASPPATASAPATALPSAAASLPVDDADLTPLVPLTHSLGQSSGNESASAAPIPPTAPEMSQAAGIIPIDATSAARGLSGGAPNPSVAEQVAPAVISLAQSGLQPGTSQKVSVSITPGDLGQVSISVEKAADGTTSIHVAAERLATLDLLRNDQSELSRALNDAGVQQSSSSLSFSWDGPASGGGSHAGQNWSNQSWSGQDGNGQHAPSGQQRSALATYADERNAGPDATAAARGGIDVTA